MSGETIFSTTGKPIPAASAASSAVVASPSPGVGMPYASATCLASGALSEVRPSARAWSRMVGLLPCLGHAMSSDQTAPAACQFLVLRPHAERADEIVGVLAEQR